MTRTFVALLFLVLAATVAVAQQEAEHPIDKALGACVEKDPSNAGTIACTEKAYQAWDKELNKNYSALMRKLKPAQQAALKSAQVEWIKGRDADFKLIDSIFDTLEGTMYISMRIESKTELVKRRALQLQGLRDIAEDASP